MPPSALRPERAPHRPLLRPTTLLPAIVVVHTAIWAAGLATFPSALPWRTTFAQYLSSFVLVVLSTNLLLATRAHWLEGLFDGLDKLFTVHRFDGATAAIVIMVHAALVPITTPIFPGRAVGITAIMLLEASVALAIAPRSPWRKLLPLKYQTWKAEHRFMGLIVATAAVHSLLVPSIVRVLPMVNAWVYGCVIVGLSAYVYRETWFRVWARRHTYRVAETSHPGADVLEIRLQPVRAPITHKAGQFAFVSFGGGPTRERHPFTLSAAPDNGNLRFSIKASGDYTKALQAGLLPESSARIEGPYGRFDFTTGRDRQLWLAGGIGITPFLAFLPTIEDDREIMLIWSVHDSSDAIYLDEVEAACANHPNLHLTVWPTAERGHLKLADIGIGDAQLLSVYLCGPVAMRDALLGQLAELGMARTDIHYEEFTLR